MTEKYLFPSLPRPTYTVYSEGDLGGLPKEGPFNLIVRGANLRIPLAEIPGDCIVRQVGCRFPTLKKVWGKLSVDAVDSHFPELETVVGDCHLHEEGISIPKLKEIWGKAKIRSQEEHPSVQFVGMGGNSPLFVNAALKTALVTTPEQAEKARSQEYVNLVVRRYNGEVPVRVVHGDLIIVDCAPSFPLLECVHGELRIIPKRRGYDMNGRLARKPYADYPVTPIAFPLLRRVLGRLFVNRNNTEFPALRQVGQLFLQRGCNEIHLDALEWVDKHVHAISEYPLTLPALRRINGNIFIEQSLGLKCPSLEYIGGGVHSYPPAAPKLEVIRGHLMLSRFSEKLPALRELGRTPISDMDLFQKAPQLKEVGELNYTREKGGIPKSRRLSVSHVLFNLSRQIAVDESGFFIHISWEKAIWEIPRHKRKRYPFGMFVGLLKLRHGAYQNFLSRQVAREWPQYQGAHWEALIRKIGEVWDETPPYTVADIFRLKDRNLRRFCFTFVGVAEIMRILKAERVSVEGMDLDYFRYDDDGNEYKIKKHNIYELYRASTKEFADLDVRWSWRNREGHVYAVKCWCTSTEKEHWLWVEAAYAKDPLTAIASTFRIHANVIPHIKCLKRQGDILICEMNKEVVPKGNIRPLTKEEYFSLLKAES